jgi:hypothetical protein
VVIDAVVEISVNVVTPAAVLTLKAAEFCAPASSVGQVCVMVRLDPATASVELARSRPVFVVMAAVSTVSAVRTIVWAIEMGSQKP